MRKTPRRLPGQRLLFDLDPPALPFENPPVGVNPPLPVFEASEEASEQLQLFEGKTPLLGELEQALADADFPKALKVRDKLSADYGPEAVPAGVGCLDRMDVHIWESPNCAETFLDTWRAIDSELVSGSKRWRLYRKGFFTRLLARHDAARLALQYPEALPPLANTLFELQRVAEGRSLVRDALLRGVECRPLDFEDESIRDILSEDMASPWLASLGVIWRVWPRTWPSAEAVARLEQEMAQPVPEDDAARALGFWRCLCAVGLGENLSAKLLHGARRRMKRLHPELHAFYMGGDHRQP